MDSITNIYKTGFGPSSSHTMGPHVAAGRFKDFCAESFPATASYRVTLYGSLAATGKGHLTDATISDALAPAAVEFLWKPETELPAHPNGMLFEALDASGAVLSSRTVYSIGGGDISEGDGPIKRVCGPAVYEFNTLTRIQKYIEDNGLSFWEYVENREGKQIWDFLAEVWKKMQECVEEGLRNDSVLPGVLHMRSKAKTYFIRAKGYKSSLQSRALVTAYALAASEQNARGGVVVTAPTCGSCGVVPAVLYHTSRWHNFSDEDILKSLATAGLFGNIIRTNASISGAEVGCQGEVGSACVMAAVALNQLFGGSPQQIECAAEMAMEHNLGLTCDPVCGLVQIPCIERNAIAALRAEDVSMYALMSDGKHLVSFDSIIETMKNTGHDLPSPYRETSLGGMASSYK